MKKALVLGANGYLGRHLARYLADAGYMLDTADRGHSSLDGHKRFQSLDFSVPEQARKLNLDCDYIFHFAGITGTSAGFETYADYVNSNDIALLNLLRHHHLSGSRARFIYPSSRLVYRGQRGVLLTEDAPKDPKTVYAQNKLTGEGYLRLFQNRYTGFSYSVFRICVPYGNRFDGHYSYGTMGFFLERASRGKNIPLYGDGSQRRTFTHIDDVCSMILKSIDHPDAVNNCFNIGGGDHCSLAAAAQLVAEKYSVEVDFEEWPPEERLLETGDTVFDAAKLENMINHSYRFNLRDWLADL